MQKIEGSNPGDPAGVHGVIPLPSIAGGRRTARPSNVGVKVSADRSFESQIEEMTT
jgi:hypothetical protein